MVVVVGVLRGDCARVLWRLGLSAGQGCKSAGDTMTTCGVAPDFRLHRAMTSGNFKYDLVGYGCECNFPTRIWAL
ncbi:hypothetical protein VNO78_28295 [Psophocarpus tetragonolobus]|uniref:Uncharacterized protein n=1 Tax=Psophocarpus tetragonolobus TaxID=3891 RepID=A0AAN9S1N5_PSOTE